MEVLIATVIIAVSLVPAAEALRSASLGSEIYSDYSTRHYLLVGKLEEVLADSYVNVSNASSAAGSATVATTYSDPVAIADRRLVFLSGYDGDNADGDDDPFTGVDPGLYWVRVEIEGQVQSLESLTTF